MAKKAFKDLSGVKLKIKGRNEESTVAHSYEVVEEITHEGDIFYMLDKDNNFEIVPVVLKKQIKNWKGTKVSYSRFIDDVKSFIPCAYDIKREEEKRNSNKVLEKILAFSFKGNRSHCGLFFTTEEEAIEWQKKIRENKIFSLLKKGDTVYCLSDKYTDKPLELSFEAINECNDGEYRVHFLNHGFVTISSTVWEDKTSYNLDTSFYAYQSSDLGKDVKLFVNEKDALKYISDVEKRKAKNATDKYIASIKNYDGKPISFNDKLGKPLHYGDIVAYAVSRGSSYPYISFGKITGETKTRVNVEDTQYKDKKHCVSCQCLLLVAEAKVNINSGYSFVK